MSASFKFIVFFLLIPALVILALRTNAFFSLTDRYLGGASHDAGLYIWLTENNIQHFPAFETNVSFPAGKSLAWSDNWIFPSLVQMLFRKFGANPVLASNLLIILAWLLNAACSMLLCLKLTRSFYSAVICGAAILCSQFLSTHIGHPQLQFFFFIPLLIYLILTERKFNYFLAGITLFLCFLTSVYYAIFIALLIVLHGLLKIINLENLKQYFINITILLISFSPCIFFIKPYLEVKAAFGARPLAEILSFSAKPLAYLTVSPYNQFLRGILNIDGFPEGQLYPGIVGLIAWLVLFYFILKLQSNFLIKFLIIISPFAKFYLHPYFCILEIPAFLVLIFSLGKVFNKNESFIIAAAYLFLILSWGPNQNAYSIYEFLYYYFPGFSAIRAPGRFGLLANLLALLILCRSLALSKVKIQVLLCLCAIPIFLFEAMERTYPLEPPIKQLKILAKFKNINTVTILLPMNTEKGGTSDSNLKVNYMLWSQKHPNLKIINGYSGFTSPFHKMLEKELANFPDLNSVQLLQSISDLEYVTIFSQKLNQAQARKISENIKKFPELKLVKMDPHKNMIFKIDRRLEINSSQKIYLPPYADNLDLSFNNKNSDVCNIYVDQQKFNIPAKNKQIINIKLDQLKDKVNTRIINLSSDCKLNLFLKRISSF